MFSEILQKVLEETLKKNDFNLDKFLIENLGEPPNINEKGLISPGKLPNIEVIEKIISINSNLSNHK